MGRKYFQSIGAICVLVVILSNAPITETAGALSKSTPQQCTASMFTEKIGTGAANEIIYFPLNFKNVSGKVCAIDTHPSLQPVFGASHRPVGLPSTQKKVRSSLLNIGMNKWANVSLQVKVVGNISRKSCGRIDQADGAVLKFSSKLAIYFALPKFSVCQSLASTNVYGVQSGSALGP